ncbi:MAG TPA: glycosyl transferase, partial [bacterium]|nr:glycosyl transferase [bacterium]
MRDLPLRPVFIALLALTAIRILAASAYPLVDDEAYYWTWSRHLAWGYPDHPPAVAAMVKLTTALVGDSAVGIRLGPIFLALL